MADNFEGTVMRIKEKEWDFKAFLTIENFRHFGIMKNPSTNTLNETLIRSPSFTAMQEGSGIQFVLTVHVGKEVNSLFPDVPPLIQVYLSLKSVPDNDSIGIHSVLSILNERGQVTKFEVGRYSGVSVGDNVALLRVGRTELLEKAETYLTGGNLTFKCEMKVRAPWKTSMILKVDPTSTGTNEYASDILKALYEDQLLSDMTLKSGTREFKCHKAVLAARSSYFKDLFTLDLKGDEPQSAVDVTATMNEVELKDFLDFVYLGTPRNLSQTALKMYEVACIFGKMSDLKRLCERELMSKLNRKNAVDMLVFSEKFPLENLKEAAIKLLD